LRLQLRQLEGGPGATRNIANQAAPMRPANEDHSRMLPSSDVAGLQLEYQANQR